MTNLDEFYEAYEYLENHPKVYMDGINYFYKCLDVDVVKVNPKTMSIDDIEELNTKVQVWLEFGEITYSDELGFVVPVHDFDFDCGADTFEEAIILLAKLVKNKWS